LSNRQNGGENRREFKTASVSAAAGDFQRLQGIFRGCMGTLRSCRGFSEATGAFQRLQGTFRGCEGLSDAAGDF